MRWTVDTLGFLLAVTQGLVIQSPAHGHASPDPWRRCPSDPLANIKAQTRLMEVHAKKLLELYMTEQKLQGPEFAQMCHTAGPSGPLGHLPALHRKLQHFRGALHAVGQQQRALNHPDAGLHEELREAQRQVGGLLANVACALGGVVPTAGPPAPAALKPFQQRIEGCKVLRSYSQFLGRLARCSQGPGGAKPNCRRRARRVKAASCC